MTRKKLKIASLVLMAFALLHAGGSLPGATGLAEPPSYGKLF